MKPHRNTKIASVIQAELSCFFARDCDFRGALVTVIGVEIGEDLLNARVKIGIIPHEKSPEVFQCLQGEKRTLQHKLLKKMRLRRVPTLQFEIVENKI